LAYFVKHASVAAALAALVVILSSFPATACSESLFRIGRGVSYREYLAPLPGNILMVTRTASDRLVAEWLSHTGHNVQAVNDPGNIAGYLKRTRFDIVLALFKDRDVVATQEASAGSNAKYLPVADSSEKEMAQAQYRQTLTTDSTPRDLLKAIHRTLTSDSNKITGS
jgi:hypothetical protein